MLSHDLKLDEIQDSKVTFSVTNNLFLTQLKSASLQNFLKEFLTQELNLTPQIENKLRPKNTAQTISFDSGFESEISYQESPENPYPDASFEMLPEAPVMPEEKAEPQSKSKVNLTQGKGIFYEVYKKLPEGFSNPEVKVYSEDIPKPEQSNSNLDWEDAIQDFDFE